LVIKSTVIFLLILGIIFYIPAHASPDAIWTTRNDCGDETQDVNHFAIGDHVYINGEGFSSGGYDWTIKGKPGGASCDPDITVASGTVVVDSSGSFCFDAYTVVNDDCGEYQVKLDTKGDNYRVTPGGFDCSDYTTQEDCDYFIDCEWCPECVDKKWSGSSDRCVDAGTCNYICDINHCGAECLSGQNDTSHPCLPQGTEIITCINNVSYVYPDYNYCRDTCEWDNCQTKVVTENDPRCLERLPPPTCSGTLISGRCFSFNRPSYNSRTPNFSYSRPSFNFPSFNFPSFRR